MAMVANVLDAPTKMAYYLELMANANGVSAIVEAAQEYLASWSQEGITSLQKIDGGWAPFDEMQQPLRICSPAALHCYRDAIHCQCIALREAGMALTPELMELDEFFCAAGKMAKSYGDTALLSQTRATRAPAIHSHADMLVNW